MKNKSLAAGLAFFLGGLGIHKCYLNRPGAGILYALFFWTFIPAILGLIEAIGYIAMSQEQFDAKYNQAVATTANAVAKPSMLKEKADGTTVAICPACAEEIKPEAVKCKHCGSAIDSSNYATQPVKPSTNPALKIVLAIIVIGVIMSGVLASLDEARTKAEQSQNTSQSTATKVDTTIDYEIVHTKPNNRHDGAPKLWVLIDPVDISSDAFLADVKSVVRAIVADKGGKITIEIYDDADALDVLYRQYGDMSLGRVRTSAEDTAVARHLIAYFSGQDEYGIYSNELNFFPNAFSDTPGVGKFTGSEQFNPM